MAHKTQLTGTVIYPNDPEYAQARMNWDPFTNAFPIVVVFVQNDRDVVNAVKWARENDVPIRIRSGRHALARDFSQANGAIVIDTSQMTNVRLDKTTGIATVQPGNRVGDLVRQLAQEGILAPFGDSSSVGIGGISTGGGITAVQRTTGLISDTILAATVVDAKGDILRVSKDENPDLFWAIRGGGGGNFGVITSYTFQVRPAPFHVGIFEIIWPWEQVELVIDAWQRWSPSLDPRLGTILEALSKENGLLHCQGIFLGPNSELEKLIAPMTGVGTPTQVSSSEVTLAEAIEFWAPNEPLFDTQSTTWSSAWAERILPPDGLQAIRQFLERAKGSESNFFFLNSGGAMNQVPSDATAFFWRSTLYYVEWDASWTREAEARENIRLVEETRTRLQPYITGSYVNVPDLLLKNYGAEYWGGNFARLQRVKAKYDPDNVFNFAQSIPPAPVCGDGESAGTVHGRQTPAG